MRYKIEELAKISYIRNLGVRVAIEKSKYWNVDFC